MFLGLFLKLLKVPQRSANPSREGDVEACGTQNLFINN